MGIKITNLTKKYDSFGTEITALDGVNLTFNDGELVAIIGESGSGKTTLLNQLCGMDVPDKGEIVIDGIDLTKLSSDELCKMVCPDASAELKEGDLICTSGAGSIYPYGIAVGRITRVEKDPYSRNTIAYIEPSADLMSASRVMVVSEIYSEVTGNE